MKRIFAFAFTAAVVCTAGAHTVEVVSANARSPWNSILDVDFKIDGAAAGDLFKVEVSAKYGNGQKNLFARTYVSEPVCGRGANRVSWNIGADYPDLKTDDLQVAVTASPMNVDSLDVYMVIDLSSGPESKRYPVSYTFTAPTLVPTNDLVACAADPNRTTKLWLKRVKSNVFPLDGCDSDLDGDMLIRVSPYYASIFEITQKQWNLVMDTWPSKFTNVLYRAARPVEMITLENIIGNTTWPDSKDISDNSFIGKLRFRTGLSTLNITTEAQQESACRAGNRNTSYGVPMRYKISSSRYDNYNYNEGPEEGTAIVGSYGANKWGFYDCCGNVNELCLDSYVTLTSLLNFYREKYPQQDIETDPVLDPLGPANTENGKAKNHVLRGGAWDNTSCLTYTRAEFKYDAAGSSRVGIRIVVSAE